MQPDSSLTSNVAVNGGGGSSVSACDNLDLGIVGGVRLAGECLAGELLNGDPLSDVLSSDSDSSNIDSCKAFFPWTLCLDAD